MVAVSQQLSMKPGQHITQSVANRACDRRLGVLEDLLGECQQSPHLDTHTQTGPINLPGPLNKLGSVVAPRGLRGFCW